MDRPPVPPRPGSGETKDRLAEILRVDHAGELAAVHIYRGQAAVFGGTKNDALAQQFKHMEGEEQVHLDAFETLMREKQVRPTLMTPVWRMAALGLGVGTALLGEKAAHACTEAVESVIGEHYAEQIRDVEASDPELAAKLSQFRDDELGHHDRAVDQGARDATGYPLLSAVIKTGCRLAIRISEKI
ncbi:MULTISPECIES: demethoxyubiquinone hydroxylase family protein [Asticcacaulis]|uniref:demethoxyubiquinone hydroxylase family protein n=1 Tax=Asticcacaulis TaxID=76890 RepID=UPI001AE64156|nr:MULTISPECIES: demethoxyubiquinone hydroxylase family protein [Asticcacaulis]MBP2161403.1 ubiquinone biosynthesis monooxygenase Coq7 [Asticcacaulis solisilvae]MDR6802448.1 ubiquinone biosynthesis monooxygenase Coq7 [Asticcacaulis sp. BE141]